MSSNIYQQRLEQLMSLNVRETILEDEFTKGKHSKIPIWKPPGPNEDLK